MWVDKLNRVALKLIFELKELGGEPVNGQPSVLEENYLVPASDQKCLQKGAPFEKIEHDEDIGQPSIQFIVEGDPNQGGEGMFDPEDPFVNDIGPLGVTQVTVSNTSSLRRCPSSTRSRPETRLLQTTRILCSAAATLTIATLQRISNKPRAARPRGRLPS